MRKLAMFGGTFNPIHNAHIGLARAFADSLGLDAVLLIPTRVPPHKAAPDIAPGEDRLAMCRLAAEEDGRFAVSDLELRRAGPSYSADTLKALQSIYPDASLYFIMGADMFLTVQNWVRPQEIYARAVLCSAPREDVSLAALERHGEFLRAQGARTALLDLPLMPYSSPGVRAALREGKSIEQMVPPQVARYLESHSLYRK